MPTPDAKDGDLPLPNGEGQGGGPFPTSPPTLKGSEDTSATAWDRLLASDAPLRLDVPILLRKLPEQSRPSRLVVEVLDEQRQRLGSAAIFPSGWYPGRTD